MAFKIKGKEVLPTKIKKAWKHVDGKMPHIKAYLVSDKQFHKTLRENISKRDIKKSAKKEWKFRPKPSELHACNISNGGNYLIMIKKDASKRTGMSQQKILEHELRHVKAEEKRR